MDAFVEITEEPRSPEPAKEETNNSDDPLLSRPPAGVAPAPAEGATEEGPGQGAGTGARPYQAAPAIGLPPVPASADLARSTAKKVWPALCFSIAFLVYVALIPHFLRYSNPPTGDQPFYLMDTISLVQDGDLNVANNYAHRDEDKFYSLAPHPPDFVG